MYGNLIYRLHHTEYNIITETYLILTISLPNFICKQNIK